MRDRASLAEIRRERCMSESDFLASDLPAEGMILTEPGDLEDTKRSAEGIGFLLGIATLAGVVIGATLATWWPELMAWSGL